MNEDYQVGVLDPRFFKVFDNWSYHFFIALARHPMSHNYTGSFEFIVSNHGGNLDKQVRADVKTAIKHLQSSPTDTMIVGYDTAYIKLSYLKSIVDQILSKRRRKDYELDVSNCFSVTAKLCPELLDDRLPRLNLLMITYNGAKRGVLQDTASIFDDPHDDADEDE